MRAVAIALSLLLALPAIVRAACDSAASAECRHGCNDTRIVDVDAAGAAYESCFGKCPPGAEGRICRNACKEPFESALTTALESFDNCHDACVTSNGCTPSRSRSRVAGLDGFALPVPGDTRLLCSAAQAEVCAGPCAEQRTAAGALVIEENYVCVAGCAAGAAGAACRAGCRAGLLDGANEAAASFTACRSRCDADAACDTESDAAAVCVAGIADFPFHDLASFGVATSRGISTRAPRAVAVPAAIPLTGRADGASLRR